jgi:hypothetical protein
MVIEARGGELAMLTNLDRALVVLLGFIMVFASCNSDRSTEPAQAIGVSFAAVDVLEELEIVAPDGEANDEFGAAVAVSGELLAVGAPRAVGVESRTGVVYFFSYEVGGDWSLEAKLSADGALPGDRFGNAVALDGDLAVVGAPLDDRAGVDAGAAFVFIRGDDGVWTQEDALVDPEAEAGAQLGAAVDIQGDRVVVGVPLGAAGGAALVFARGSSGEWDLERRLGPSLGTPGDSFGFSVALSGDRAIVGASTATFSDIVSGAAYVFIREGAGTWTEEALLTAADARAFDDFGFSVAIEGDRVLVGAPGADFEGLTVGAVYVFERGDEGWGETARMVLPDAAMHDRFGNAVALTGDVAVSGAWGRDDLGVDAGAAYLFVQGSAGSWDMDLTILASDGATGDSAGSAVDIEGNLAVVGAYIADGLEPDSGLIRVLSLLRGDGDPCLEGSLCESGICVDGVCCDSECGGGDLADCQACSVATGGEVDGVCGMALDGQSCDDGLDATSSDMCTEGECSGTEDGDGGGCRAGAGRPSSEWSHLLFELVLGQ